MKIYLNSILKITLLAFVELTIFYLFGVRVIYYALSIFLILGFVLLILKKRLIAMQILAATVLFLLYFAILVKYIQ
jgi:hypothetical protein